MSGDLRPERRDHGGVIDHGKYVLTLEHPELTRLSFAEGRLRAVFDVYDPKLRFGVYEEDANPARVALTLSASTRIANGHFIGVDTGGRRPVKRTIPLRGIAMKHPVTGGTQFVGYFLFPSADGKSRLSGSLEAASAP